MKNLKFSLWTCLLALLLVLLSGCANRRIYTQQQREAERVLIWADEFEGFGVPDTLKWEREEYNRRNNDEGPYGWWSKEDSYLDGIGNLVIRVREIENKNIDNDSLDYSVGAIRTKGKFEQQYGRFEIRCMLPNQPGWL